MISIFLEPSTGKSFKAGGIADAIHLTNSASKGRSGGRLIPLNKELKAALAGLKALEASRRRPSQFVISTERATSTSSYAIVNLFSGWYREPGFVGCSSHSGRRTVITAWARRISSVGGSLRDVQVLAGHSALVRHSVTSS